MEHERTLQALIQAVSPPEEAARQAARQRWNRIAKPIGSLGLLERAVENIAALTGESEVDLTEKAVMILCADNGVTAQGVAQADSSVTAIAARELAQGRTAVCRMARIAGCRVVPVDLGIRDFPGFPGVLDRRIRNGTEDFTLGPAMDRDQAAEAVLTGIRLAEAASKRGIRLLAAGEMGIGNTTTASAVVSVLLDLPPEAVTGRGAGLSRQGLDRKIQTIREGIQKNAPDPGDPLDVLSKVGGLDLAGMCGLYLGGALYRIPVLMDGFPSAAGALCALRLCPQAGKAVFASHVSAEPAGNLLLDAIGKRPLLTAGLRLGEGTGAVAVMPLLDMALAVYREAYTFADGGIPAYAPEDAP